MAHLETTVNLPLLRSRIAPLTTFGKNSWVKRDDELSFGISGSKVRKFRGVFQAYEAGGFDGIVALGSAYSHNLIGLAQVCNENQIPLYIVCLESTPPLKGNGVILNWLVPANRKHIVARSAWSMAEQIATELTQKIGGRLLVLPEGCVHPSACMGITSLMDEILEFEQEKSIFFDQIYLDAGTGLTAQTLICLGDAKRRFFVVQMAGNSSQFCKGLTQVGIWLNKSSPAPFELIKPPVGKSFGSTPKRVFDEMQYMAREEGILCDPIYSGKFFMTVRGLNRQDYSQRLLIHSGGGLSLTGFLG